MSKEHITLDMRGPRGALTAEKARTYLEPVFSGEKRDYTRIILSTWAFSVEAAELVGSAIELLPNLESAILADIIAGRPEAEGLAVFRALGKALKNVKLKELDLSDNAVGPKGVEATREMLSGQEHLEKLLFVNCGMSAEAMRSVADILLFRVPTKLKLLHFGNNMSGSGGAIALADIVAASPDLEDFRFFSSRGAHEGGIALAKAFEGCTKLVRLDVSDNIFGLDGSLALCRMLRTNRSLGSTLKELNVGDILMKDKGVLELSKALVRSGCRDKLEFLGLQANEISAKGAPHVARLLRRLTALKTLRLEENEIEDEGLKYLTKAVAKRARFRAIAEGNEGGDPNSADPLTSLYLGTNFLKTAALVRFASVAAKTLPNLTTLDIKENDEVFAGGVEKIKKALGAKASALVTDDATQAEDGDDEEDDEEDEGEGGYDEDGIESDLEEMKAGGSGGAASGAGATAVANAGAAGAQRELEKEVSALAASLGSELTLDA